MEVIKLMEKFNAAQVAATLTLSIVNMMSNDDRCFVCGKTGHIGHHCPDTQCYNCEDFGHFTQDCPDKILPSGMPCHHDRLCSWPHYNHNCKDRSSSLTTDAAKEETLTGQDHTVNPTTTEGPSTIEGMHPTPHSTTTVLHATHQLTNAVGDTITRTHCASTTVTHPRHATFRTESLLRLFYGLKPI